MEHGSKTIGDWLAKTPLVAILRGIQPHEVVAVGRALVEAGFALLEVPLNSPRPMESIRLLTDALGNRALIGAGTVLDPEDVARVAGNGGRLIVTPHTDPDVIRAAKGLGMVMLPGFFTPSEAVAAIRAGADGLKLFPAENAPPPVLRAMTAVLPPGVPLLPVGGITADSLEGYWRAGASGFGLGSALYRPGMEIDELRRRAGEFVSAMRALRNEAG